MKRGWLGVLLVGVFLTGCSRTSQTPEAVRRGIVEYLASRSDLDLEAIQVDVTSVNFRQNEADATVAFRPKGGAPGSGMEMRYTLELKEGQWAVKGKGQSLPGIVPHGAPAPEEGAQAPESRMPSDHPPLGRAKPAGPAK